MQGYAGGGKVGKRGPWSERKTSPQRVGLLLGDTGESLWPHCGSMKQRARIKRLRSNWVAPSFPKLRATPALAADECRARAESLRRLYGELERKASLPESIETGLIAQSWLHESLAFCLALPRLILDFTCYAPAFEAITFLHFTHMQGCYVVMLSWLADTACFHHAR